MFVHPPAARQGDFWGAADCGFYCGPGSQPTLPEDRPPKTIVCPTGYDGGSRFMTVSSQTSFDESTLVAHAGLFGHLVAVDHVEAQFLGDDLPLDCERQLIPNFVRAEGDQL